MTHGLLAMRLLASSKHAALRKYSFGLLHLLLVLVRGSRRSFFGLVSSISSPRFTGPRISPAFTALLPGLSGIRSWRSPLPVGLPLVLFWTGLPTMGGFVLSAMLSKGQHCQKGA